MGICFSYALVYHRIRAIRIELIETPLVGVIRRVAHNHADGLFVLLLYPQPVLLGQPAQVKGALPGNCAPGRPGPLPVHIVQGVHKAEVGELQVMAGPFLVGIFDVQVGDVVGQYRHLVGVDFVPVLLLQPVGGQVVNQVGNEGAGAGGRVEDLHLFIGQAAAKVLLQQVVSPPDDKVHHFVGSIDHAQAVGSSRVVGLVKVLVNRLEELLLFGVIGNSVGSPANDPIVGAQAVNSFPAHVAGKEGLLQGVQVPGDVVFPVELVLGKHPQENVLGQDVLEQHFPHVGAGHLRADGLPAQVEESGGGGLVVGVARFGDGHGLPQIVQHGGQVGLELPLRPAELFDVGQFVVEEAAYQPVQFPGAGHIHPQGHVPVLNQDGGFRVLKDYVVLRVAPVELVLNFGVQVVVAVFGLPVAPGHP